LVGDRLYGGKRPALPVRLDRILLHARLLGFVHPVTGERLRFESPPPPEFAAILALLRAPSKLGAAPTAGLGS
jgi:23S rRNA pseudouridine1911/1915/1917 synthase